MKAGNFVLKDQYGNDFELYKNLSSSLLLVFYPKNKSLVCSVQLKDYSKNLDLFAKSGIKLAAVNNGLPHEHSLFCTDKNLNIILLSDPDFIVAGQFSALYPFKIIKRKLILIDKNCEIVFKRTFSPYRYWGAEKILEHLAEKTKFFNDLTINHINN